MSRIYKTNCSRRDLRKLLDRSLKGPETTTLEQTIF